MLLTICLGLVALLVYFVFIRKGPSRDGPPHPGWLPFVGSEPFVKPALSRQLSEQFPNDPVVTIFFGLERLFCLNSYEALKEAFVAQGDKFEARQRSIGLKELTGEFGGIVIASGQQWRDYRRFTLKTLRDFGFGRQGAEEVISNEAQLLCETINESGGSALDTVPLMSTAISNVICHFVFGSRLASEDPKFERILEIFKKLLQAQNSSLRNIRFALYSKYFLSVPFLFKLVRLTQKKGVNVFKELIDFCKQQMDQHRREMEDVAQAKDYIDAHLRHQQTHPEFNDVRLTLSVADLFLAGTDTTSHTTRWAILFMIDNPHVAERVFQEINSTVGRERLVTMKDKADLHYTNATIEEVHRLASLVPTGVMRRSTEDAEVCGFTIPADSHVICNIYHIHRSHKLFPDPHKFKPDRFLDQEGRFRPSEFVVPFGVGKRACLGESLARMELFIFFVTLVQRYRFSLDSDDKRSIDEIMRNEESDGSSIRAPAAHKIVFTSRD